MSGWPAVDADIRDRLSVLERRLRAALNRPGESLWFVTMAHRCLIDIDEALANEGRNNPARILCARADALLRALESSHADSGSPGADKG